MNLADKYLYLKDVVDAEIFQYEEERGAVLEGDAQTSSICSDPRPVFCLWVKRSMKLGVLHLFVVPL